MLGEQNMQKKRDEPAWITDNIKTLINEEQKFYQKWLSDRTETNWGHYKQKKTERYEPLLR